MSEKAYIHYSNVEMLPNVDETGNLYFTQVIGNKEDVASNTADTASIVALLRYIIANEDANITAIMGALDTAAKTGAVDDATTVMGYVKQLVTQLLATDIVADTILADTNELQTDWTDGGRLDLLLDAIKVVTDALPDAGALTSIAQGTDLATLDGKVDVIDGLLDVPTEDLATDDTINQVIGKKSDTVAGNSLVSLVKNVLADILAAQTDVSTIETSTTTTIPGLIDDVQTQVDTIEELLDGTTATPNAYRREAGKTQVLEVAVTSAADAGSVTLATVTGQPCTIKSIILTSNGATTVDLTSAAIEGGAGSVIEFISAATATQAALDAADKQVTFTGVRRIPATGAITIDLQGTGATAVDLTVSIEYFATVDGGYLA